MQVGKRISSRCRCSQAAELWQYPTTQVCSSAFPSCTLLSHTHTPSILCLLSRIYSALLQMLPTVVFGSVAKTKTQIPTQSLPTKVQLCDVVACSRSFWCSGHIRSPLSLDTFDKTSERVVKASCGVNFSLFLTGLVSCSLYVET